MLKFRPRNLKTFQKANDTITYNYTFVFKINGKDQTYPGLVMNKISKNEIEIFTRKNTFPLQVKNLNDIEYSINGKPRLKLADGVSFYTVFLSDYTLMTQSKKLITVEALIVIAKTLKSKTPNSQSIVVYDKNEIIYQEGTVPVPPPVKPDDPPKPPVKPVDPPVKPVDPPVKPVDPPKPDPIPTMNVPLIFKIKNNSTTYPGLYVDQKGWIVKQGGDSDNRNGHLYYQIKYGINDQPRILLSIAIDLFTVYQNKETPIVRDNNQMITMDALKIIANILKSQSKSNTKIAFYDPNQMLFSIIDEQPPKKPDEPVKPNPSGLKPCPVGFDCKTVGEKCQDANGTVWHCNAEARTFADGNPPCKGPCWNTVVVDNGKQICQTSILFNTSSAPINTNVTGYVYQFLKGEPMLITGPTDKSILTPSADIVFQKKGRIQDPTFASTPYLTQISYATLPCQGGVVSSVPVSANILKNILNFLDVPSDSGSVYQFSNSKTNTVLATITTGKTPSPPPTTNVDVVYKIKNNATSYPGLYVTPWDSMEWIVKQNETQRNSGFRYYAIEYSINDQPRTLLASSIDLYSSFQKKETLIPPKNNQMLTLEALKMIANTLKSQNKNNLKISFYEFNKLIYEIDTKK